MSEYDTAVAAADDDSVSAVAVNQPAVMERAVADPTDERLDHVSSSARLPPVLAALYCLNAVVMSLPSLAFVLLLNNDLGLSQSSQSRFYGVIFVPYTCRPLFTFLAREAQYRYKVRVRHLLATAYVLSSVCYLGAAWLSHSEIAVYVICFFRALFDAATEFGIDILMVQLVAARAPQVHGSPPESRLLEHSQRVQSRATAARITGSLVSLLAGLPLYGCGGSGASGTEVRAGINVRGIIALTAALPLAGAFVSLLWLPATERAVLSPATQQTEALGSRQATRQSTGTLVAAGCFQCALVTVSLREILPSAVWIASLVAFTMFVFGAPLWVFVKSERHAGAGSRLARYAIVTGFFMFVLNAVPSVETTWFNFVMYTLDSDACRLQQLSIVSELVSLLACAVFPLMASCLPSTGGPTNADTRPTTTSPRSIARMLSPELAVVAAACVAAMLQLIRFPATSTWTTVPSQGVWGMSAFQYNVIVAAVGGFGGRIAFLSLQVLCTVHSCNTNGVLRESDRRAAESDAPLLDERSGFNARGGSPPARDPNVDAPLAYSIFLSLLDFGDSASSWLAAPLLAASGVQYDPPEWDGLGFVLAVHIGCKCTVAVLGGVTLAIARLRDGAARHAATVPVDSLDSVVL